MAIAGTRTKVLLYLCASMLLCLSAKGLAQTTGMTPEQIQTVSSQSADNTRWMTEATALESQLITAANGFIRSKEYAKADATLRNALTIQFKQWVFPVQIVNGAQTLLPASTTTTVNLTDTPRSRKKEIQTLLQNLPNIIQRDREKAISDLFTQADAAIRIKDYAKAYKAYSDIIAFAATRPDDKKTAQSGDTAQTKLAAMLKDAQAPLDNSQTLIEDGKLADAQAMLDKFQKDNKALLDLCKDVKARFTGVTNTPELLKWNREEAAKRRVALGDAALARKDYVNAFSHYRFVSDTYGDTDIGRQTTEKLAKLYADPAVAETIRAYEMDMECKALLTRAEMMAGMGDTKTAKEACATILKKYPDSEWAKKAQETLAKLNPEPPKP